ncbi:diguanylate cyclase [Shewanella sp. D64]|nr:diguanylate cyclase [Shewanella sp. D64]MEC4740193.1 diguanylate cyclase [Shewanella sp. E94]WBJ96276.1 diguanylate cyclase [Shewanella sp. MTB7]
MLHIADLDINVSVGISIFPQHANDLESLLSVSDLAMYQSKQAGRN